MEQMTQEQADAYMGIKQTIVKLRGEIIDLFATMEFVIDEIIRKTAFDTEEQFYEKAKLLSGSLSMRDKKEYFSICIQKYALKYSQDMTDFNEKINTIINVRTQMAHWYTDISFNGIELYIKKKKIRLVSIDMNKKEVESFYNIEYVNNFEKIIVPAMQELIKMKNTIDSNS